MNFFFDSAKLIIFFCKKIRPSLPLLSNFWHRVAERTVDGPIVAIMQSANQFEPKRHVKTALILRTHVRMFRIKRSTITNLATKQSSWNQLIEFSYFTAGWAHCDDQLTKKNISNKNGNM